jgi:hypothetical protein
MHDAEGKILFLKCTIADLGGRSPGPRSIARAAARCTGRVPWVPDPQQRALLRSGTMPPQLQMQFLADYVPAGWQQTAHKPLIVDMGGGNRVALTPEQVASEIANDDPGSGYALTMIDVDGWGALARFTRTP